MMRAGQLRHRVILQQRSVTRDTMGGEIITWNTVDTVNAAVEPLRGAELFAAQQIQAELTVRIRIRYRPDIDENWRVLVDGRVFTVEGPPIDYPEMRHIELHLMCSEGV